MADNGDLDADTTHRIQSGWKNWKSVSGILCDRRISLIVKGKVRYTRGNFDRWVTLTTFSFQHFPLNATGSSNYFDW